VEYLELIIAVRDTLVAAVGAMSKFTTNLRAAGWFLGNVLTASIGTKTATDELGLSHLLRRIVHPDTFGGRALEDDILTALIAFALGYFVYYKWRSSSAKWVWPIGLGWLTYRVLKIWFEQQALRTVTGASPPIFWELAPHASGPVQQQFETWINTLVFLRTAFYSMGAACCSYMIGRRPEVASLED
jgi:hypothetical protein